MRELILIGIAALCLMNGLTCVAWGAVTSLPEARAERLKGTLNLDGKLEESTWEQAGFPYTMTDYMTGGAVENKTEFVLLYDDKYLYVGVVCHESRMDKTVANHTTDNNPVFMDDSLEVYIVPGETACNEDLYHFVMNIAGARYADLLGNYAYPTRANCRMVDWIGKTAKYVDRWTAEIAIPLALLKKDSVNDAFWRINICRNNKVTGQSSAWSPTKGGYLNTFAYGLLKGIDFDGKFIGFRNEVKPIENKAPKADAPAVFPLVSAASLYERPATIIPVPYQVTYTEKDFVLGPKTKIVVGGDASAGNLQAVREFNEELKERFGVELPVVRASEVGKDDYQNAIVLGEPGKNPAVDTLLTRANQKVDATTPGPEGYILNVSPEGVLIAGSDDAGTYYGVQSLKQLLYKTDDAIHLKGAKVWDKPAFKVRMVHFFVDKDSPAVHRKMIEKLFARYKYNHILMESEHGIAWKSRPEIVSDFAAEPEKITELVRFAKQHYMTVTPLIQSLGHGGWMFRNNQNLDFAENPQKPDIYCPLNPKSYEFIFAVMDEALEIFDHPEYLHIGHDEHDLFNPFPVHPECKKVGNENLYYMDTLHIYHHLKLKGVKTMMWAEILQRPSFQRLVDVLPRDIVMADWIYADVQEFPSVDYFQDKGFQVLGCTWFRPRNIARFSRSADKSNALGMMYTTWAGYDQNISIVEREYYQVMGYITQADYAWNPNHRLADGLGEKVDNLYNFPYYAGEVLREQWYPEMRKSFNHAGFAVNLNGFVNTFLVNKNGQPALGGFRPGDDLSELIKDSAGGELHLMDDVHYRLAELNAVPAAVMLKGFGSTADFPGKITGIPVNQYASELNFLYLFLQPAAVGQEVGAYQIHYDDGAVEEIPLEYKKNIASWNDWETYFFGDLAWLGRLQSDTPVFIRSLRWTNPHPEKKIVSFDVLSEEGLAAPVLLAVTGVTPAEKTK